MRDRDGRVLIIEDDDSLRGIVARHLRANGYHVDEASSAEGAANVIEGDPRPDVVLLDLHLPGKSGWDLLRGPALNAAGSPPVIITSATTVSPKRLAESGCAAYLPKPFPPEALLATLERVLGTKSESEA
jgi:DNA-binding response OmpR family regulator